MHLHKLLFAVSPVPLVLAGLYCLSTTVYTSWVNIFRFLSLAFYTHFRSFPSLPPPIPPPLG